VTTANWYLLCFAFGFIWAIASLLTGSLRIHGHVHSGHLHHHGSLHGGHNGSHGSRAASNAAWDFLNIHSIAIFLAWFGGCGYLMSRHSGLAVFAIIVTSTLAGLAASFAVVSLLRFLSTRERVLDPLDYEMTGVLGRVSSPIRQGGTGEIFFVRDGARTSACARSDDGQPIPRGSEVVVTRYQAGIAYVRTWDSFAEAGNDLELNRGEGEAPRA
jgi:membrane protein implicated in regulation of membrane protease activity